MVRPLGPARSVDVDAATRAAHGGRVGHSGGLRSTYAWLAAALNAIAEDSGFAFAAMEDEEQQYAYGAVIYSVGKFISRGGYMGRC